MHHAVVVRGHFDGQTFIPEEPMPKVQGAAELIVFAPANGEGKAPRPSIFDFFGKAPQLRSAADIEAQIRAEHDAWGEP
jgi:hypothetical protein